MTRGAIEGKRGGSGFVIFTSLLGLVAFGAWAHWAELDQVSRAVGKVIPSGRVQVVQSADGGVITEIKVREGDTVTRGELLVRLDTVRAKAAFEDARAKEAALRAAATRIEAELYDKPLVFDSLLLKEYEELVANQASLYTRRRAALFEELETLEQMHGLLSQELAMNEPLLETGDVSRSEVLRLQRQVAEVAGQIVNRRNRYLQELQTELARTQEDLMAAEQSRAQREDQLRHTEIHAPADGIVKNVRFTTVGAVLRPGDEVLQIVPDRKSVV